ncbi:MAG TPA: amidohydrolase family protein [Streptosporangiaceae bacterium]|nr:amidohydrolase family protein [Streptosporangiaceae bacterium]
MLDGRLLVDAHVHVARLPTLSADWQNWVATFGSGAGVSDLFDASGAPRPAALDAYFAAEGADHVLLFSEYSPKSTGIQPIEDVLPVVAQNPARFRPVANINPHLHYPVKAELARQVSLGAIACKIHPVHGGFEPADRMLYPAYALCEEHAIPVIVHCGTSTFAGSVNAYGEPALLDPVFRDFPDLTVVLAHGGRGWWYDQAAFLALMRPNIWLEVSGLPPARLPDYYGRALARLARKIVFGTDWPGVPGVQRNARALEKVLLESGCTEDEVTLALGGNAARIFGLSDDQRSLT